MNTMEPAMVGGSVSGVKYASGHQPKDGVESNHHPPPLHQWPFIEQMESDGKLVLMPLPNTIFITVLLIFRGLSRDVPCI